MRALAKMTLRNVIRLLYTPFLPPSFPGEEGCLLLLSVSRPLNKERMLFAPFAPTFTHVTETTSRFSFVVSDLTLMKIAYCPFNQKLANTFGRKFFYFYFLQGS